ncbi:hypothetical protein ACHHYP_20435 [Achlya hypogyna]|uniref:Uncharacterized protein n=1 Tax=Achlya hypogyna TaxID=1202772 RepID=A0A1V9YML1_ACHHY|nr:hypothetical protein ACHHYP_20435 [Achlya hypogyna]
MRPGKFSDGREQPMVFEAGTENAGQAKGIKKVLLERGIDVAAHGLRMKCPNENVDSYHLGCDDELTKYAHKKYRSHRRIPDSILQEKDAIIAEMEQK